MINDPKERKYYTLKRCCNNCKSKRDSSPSWPFKSAWCSRKKKHLGHDLGYDTGCGLFVPLLTPEEVKEWRLYVREALKKLERIIK